jgi:DNA-binding NarL/FixJ family response regulator
MKRREAHRPDVAFHANSVEINEPCANKTLRGTVVMFIVTGIVLPVVRKGLCDTIQDRYPDAMLDHAQTLDGVERSLTNGNVDLLVIDLSLPELRGSAGLRRLRDTWPDVAILVMTSSDNRSIFLECLNAGVHGVVSWSAPLCQLLLAVTTALAKGIYAPPGLAEQSSAEDHVPWPRQSTRTAVKLTARQSDVIRLAGEGRSNKDIARRLGLGLGTVMAHLSTAYAVLGTHSRLGAVINARMITVQPSLARA